MSLKNEFILKTKHNELINLIVHVKLHISIMLIMLLVSTTKKLNAFNVYVLCRHRHVTSFFGDYHVDITWLSVSKLYLRITIKTLHTLFPNVFKIDIRLVKIDVEILEQRFMIVTDNDT